MSSRVGSGRTMPEMTTSTMVWTSPARPSAPGDLRGAVARDPLAGGVTRGCVRRVDDEPVLAQPLRVLGDRGEVERPAQLVLLGVVERRA